MRSTVGEVVRLAGGTLLSGTPSARFEGGVSIDSRTLRRGDLFFAIAGPRHDGHSFLREVVERGAAGVVIHEKSEVPRPVFSIQVKVPSLKSSAKGRVACNTIL